MLNLLFITDSPRAEQIKNELQPFLKVLLDVKTDFDRGMKDVFEKRPATVCIQDRIGTVTAESVARHIQMLLGNGAPTFILLHSGDDKAQVIPGLFEHLIDISLSNKVVIKNILSTLKPLLGSQWERIYLPPQAVADRPVPPKKAAPAVAETAPPLETLSHTNAEVPADSLPEAKDVKSDPVSSEPVPTPAPAPLPPAEAFKISGNTSAAVEDNGEDLLLAFEKNYRSRSPFKKSFFVIIVLICIVSAGGWYLFTQQPQLVTSLTQRFLPSPAAKKAPVTAPTNGSAQNPAAPPIAAPLALPSFIPRQGFDKDFGLKNSGWRRFVGEQFEFRVFTAPKRIEAVQVLSTGAAIPQSLITSVLQEFIGSPQYKILSRATKDGVHIESGSVQDKGEIKLYRKNGLVTAFVVSVN